MEIKIGNRNNEPQKAIIIIKTDHLVYPYSIRNTIELALKLDGYTKETIDEVFGRTPIEMDVKQEQSDN